MNVLTPLPPYIASNMTDEEFQNLLDRSEVPAYVRERFAALLDGEREEIVEANEARAEEESNAQEHSRKAKALEDAIGELREPWDKLARILNPENSVVKAMESAIKAAEEVA